MLKTHTIKLIF